MYPHINLFNRDISSFTIMLVLGILAALLCYRFLVPKSKMPTSSYNFYLLGGVLAIGAGMLSAFLFQAFYNYRETGKFKLEGITVMGGILGAAIFFVLYAIILSSFKPFKQHRSYFWTAVNYTIPCVVIAQCIGRIGCFLGGCCYGKETTSALGVRFVENLTKSGDFIYHDHDKLPTQLFESIFMLILFVAMVIVLLKFKKTNLPILMYTFGYSIFRFIIEFFRDDPRGAFFLGMSPSQLQSLLLFSIGVALTITVYFFKKIPLGGKSDTKTSSES